MNPETDILQKENTYSTHDEYLINKLKELPPIAYDRVRTTFAKEMGIRSKTLDLIMRDEKEAFQDEDKNPFVSIKPWHEPINPENLLTEIADTIKRFIVCDKDTVIAATLWAAMTWFIDVIHVAPLAVISAPEKRCGKSQLLFLLSRLVCRPIVASNITTAALFRAIDLWHPTLLIDEADTFMRENEELRGLINCGHTRDSAYIIRVVGEEHTPKTFFVWGAQRHLQGLVNYPLQ